MKRTGKAFTLIELMVVVAIIAVLVAMLLPALSEARRRARWTLCAARMKNWGQAVQSYAMDNSDVMPSRGEGVITDPWDRWPRYGHAERRNELRDHYGLVRNVWYSPDERGDIESMWREDRTGRSRVFGGYFYLPRHRELSLRYTAENDTWPIGIRQDLPTPSDVGEMISDPSPVPVLTDVAYLGSSWEATHETISGEVYAGSQAVPQLVHSLWLDGHVEARSFSEIYRKNYAYRFGGQFTW